MEYLQCVCHIVTHLVPPQRSTKQPVKRGRLILLTVIGLHAEHQLVTLPHKLRLDLAQLSCTDSGPHGTEP